MDITLSDSCLNMKQNPLLSLLNGQDKSKGLFDDSQDGRLKMFESTFSLIANELLEHKNRLLASMSLQITSALDNHHTSSGLQKEFPGQANLIINKHIEQLVEQLDNSIIVLSERYNPWLQQLMVTTELNLSIKRRVGDEDTSVIGLLAGLVVGGGVAGLGGAFLGGIVGDLAGGLFGEPVEKLRKRVARRVNKKVNQIENHTAELFDALLPEVKQSLINSSHYPWVETPKPGAGQNLEIN